MALVADVVLCLTGQQSLVIDHHTAEYRWMMQLPGYDCHFTRFGIGR